MKMQARHVLYHKFVRLVHSVRKIFKHVHHAPKRSLKLDRTRFPLLILDAGASMGHQKAATSTQQVQVSTGVRGHTSCMR